MSSIIIKVIDKNTPEKAAQAIGELEGAGFSVSLQEETDFLGVDANKHGGGESTYGPCYIVIGKK